MKPFEQDVLRFLIGDAIQPDTLERIANATNCEVDHTACGYFLTVCDSAFPEERRVFSEPIVIGETKGIEVGFVVFLEHGKMTLECHGWNGGQVPQDIRELPLAIRKLAQDERW